jgi:hypothetical protein
MKYNHFTDLLILTGCCSVLIFTAASSVSASEKVFQKPERKTAQSSKNSQRLVSQRLKPNKAKANSAKSLGVIPAIDLAKTPQLLSQQTIDQTNPTPVTDPASPPAVTVPTDLAPPAEPVRPAPAVPSSAEPQFPSGEQVKPNPSTIDPGRKTRSGSSYVGVGANVGGFGNTSVGSPGLMLYSKIGLTRYFSVRPAVVTDFSNDATFILPATFDLAPIRLGSVGSNAISVAPYIGGGATITTDGDARALLTGGVDVPINSRFTATLGLNTTFGNDVDLGGFIGVGYNF